MYKLISISILLFYFLNITCGLTQEVIPLPVGEKAKAIKWSGDEKEYFTNIWQTQVVTNVSNPTLTVFRPAKENINGTSVIICPGGGLYALSIESEGREVARWLNEKGVTAFVLKYRLVPTGEDGVADISNSDGPTILKKAGEVLPVAIEDGLNAIDYVRKNAESYGLHKNRIGIIGFSAGGAVTMGVTYNYEESNRPDFIGPVYAWMDVVPAQGPPADAPPMFAVCASDDPLNLAPASVKLYSEWLEAKKNVELHMYAEGGHGFGMRKQGLPSDQWIDRFGEWLKSQGWLEKDEE